MRALYCKTSLLKRSIFAGLTVFCTSQFIATTAHSQSSPQDLNASPNQHAAQKKIAIAAYASSAAGLAILSYSLDKPVDFIIDPTFRENYFSQKSLSARSFYTPVMQTQFESIAPRIRTLEQEAERIQENGRRLGERLNLSIEREKMLRDGSGMATPLTEAQISEQLDYEKELQGKIGEDAKILNTRHDANALSRRALRAELPKLPLKSRLRVYAGETLGTALILAGVATAAFEVLWAGRAESKLETDALDKPLAPLRKQSALTTPPAQTPATSALQKTAR